MSTSVIHVMTIIGNAADEVEASCESLSSRPGDERLDRLCPALVNAARQPPVVFYVQYLDYWTVADSRFQLMSWPDGRRRQICGERFGLAFYPSGFSNDYLAEIEGLRQTDLYRDQAEDRWYINNVKEAIESASWMNSKFLVVAIRETIGPSRLDEDITAALKTSIDLH